MSRRAQISHAGFTLVEALIALTVLSIGLMGLAHLQMRVFASSGHSKTQTIAVNLAQQKLESLRATPYDSIESGADAPEPQVGHNAHFTRRWIVADRSAPDYKAIRITAAWQTPDGEARSVSLGSFIARSIAHPLGPVGLPAADE
ncbi:MAG: type IV pilus modification protein PilV [Thiocapsa sp.]|jgi:type IV pilus modification protein PilV|nr:type IV pilus modification protein PilV [Thiocapsa sp.]MCG6895750.1 type IV pilus modification protein PilV [Thiocapsa sp.]